ncbi:MAG: DUF2330 domain-containing protein [Verrucomicrobiales bacterium]|nr:DUF2330 domain-containing protein [Verrucomicrobiales bacterium]
MFSPAAYARAETPEQRALIHWEDGVETLVVETTVQSQATNLSWIIPLPSKPLTIRPADPGLFPTLQSIFQPRVLSEVRWTWLGGAAAWLAILVGRWRRQRKLPVRFVDVMVVLGFLLILFSMLLPSLGKAKGGETGSMLGLASEVTVLSEERAGVFEVVTLSATKGDHLTAWLESRGFAVPAGIAPVAQDYLAQGWIFVAARVRNRSPGLVAPLHPLLFRFATPTAVYPMRLTGVGAQSLVCDLYVFGRFRAEAEGWQVRYCGIPDFTSRSRPAMSPYPLRVRNPELASIVAGSAVATKLSARLTTHGMAQDVTLHWRPVRSEGQTLSTWKAALSEALLYPAWVLALAAFLGGMTRFHPQGVVPWLTLPDRLGAVAAVAVYSVGILTLPVVPPGKVETIGRRLGGEVRNALSMLAADACDSPAVQDFFRSSEPEPKANTLAELRRALAVGLRNRRGATDGSEVGGPLLNPFTGRPMRFEASPGNLEVEYAANRLDLVWYDFDGAEAFRYDIPRLDSAPPPAQKGVRTDDRGRD